jgi:protein-tyrosine phosphatase
MAHATDVGATAVAELLCARLAEQGAVLVDIYTTLFEAAKGGKDLLPARVALAKLRSLLDTTSVGGTFDASFPALFFEAKAALMFAVARATDLEGQSQLNHQAENMLNTWLRRPSLLLPGLYIGSAFAADDEVLLTELGVTHVLTLNGADGERAYAWRNHISLALADTITEDLTPYFPPCIAFIDSALATSDGCVLVHCAVGRSRSCAISAAFVMHRFGVDSDTALELVRAARLCSEPNAGFVRQLRERKNVSTTSVPTTAQTPEDPDVELRACSEQARFVLDGLREAGAFGPVVQLEGMSLKV